MNNFKRHCRQLWKFIHSLLHYAAILIMCFFYGVNYASAEQRIALKGYTQTTVSRHGTITDVRTQTVSGRNAYNAFSRFGVSSGNTVNLHLPQGTQNLLNLVYDQKSQIDGVLNAYKNGQIGGNIFFANPHGLVIGQSGIVNVGKLSVSTPTPQFMDSFFSGQGNPSAQATQQLLDGTAPQNANASIDIQGQINAGETVLKGGYIDVSGDIHHASADQLTNLGEQPAATNIKQINGEIVLYAENDIDITGTINNDAASDTDAGRIDIQAGGEITVAGQAAISAQGKGGQRHGGSITVLADKKAVIKEQATIDASAIDDGDAGFIEFSAKKTVKLAGGNLRADAQQGQDGTVLIDPENLIVSSNLLRGQSLTATGISWSAGSLTLQADNILTINNNVVVSTRSVSLNSGQTGVDAHLNNHSTGDSGDLILIAPSIQLNQGAKLLTFADSGYKSGNISLTAIQNAYQSNAEIIVKNNVLLKSQSAGNSVSGHIDFDVQGIANFANTLVPVYNEKNTRANISIDSAILQAGDINLSATANSKYAIKDGAIGQNIQEGAIDFLGSLTPVAGVAVSNAESKVLLKDSNLIAQGNVSIQSSALTEAKATTPSMLIGVVYGRADNTAETHIEGTTAITGNNVDIGATSDSDLAVSAVVVSTTSKKVGDVAISVSDSAINTQTDIGQNTFITATGDVNIHSALTRKSSTKSTAMALEGAVAGMALSISNSQVNTRADVQGTVIADGNISVSANSNTLRNETEASVTVGTSPLIGAVIYNATNALRDKAGLYSSSTSPGALAAGVSVADHKNMTSATISHTAQVQAGNGNVDVDALITDHVQLSSNASIASTERNEKANALSGSVTVAHFDNSAQAKISQSSVDAAKDIGVHARVSHPYEVMWHQIEGIGDITDKINPNLGIQNGFFTTWAGNKSNASGEAAGAAVNNVDYHFSSVAVIDNDARINRNNAVSGNNRSVDVSARNLLETVNLAGTFISAGDSNTGGRLAAGGAYLGINYQSDTHAAIEDTVQLTAADLAVTANTTSRNVSIAGAGTKGGNVSVTGSTSNLNVNNTTIATISGDAQIQLGQGAVTVSAYDANKEAGFDPAKIHYLDSTHDGIVDTNDAHINGVNSLQYATDLSLLVAAEDEADLYNITGGVTAGKNAGIGNSVSRNTIQRRTESIIGTENSTQVPYTGSMTTPGNILLASQNTGDIYAFSLAGSYSRPASGSTTSTKSGTYGIAVSGDTALNSIDDVTSSFINNATLHDPAGIDLTAYSDSKITAASGSAAIVSGGGKSIGIAGSYSQNDISGKTSSYITNSAITGAGIIGADAAFAGGIFSLSAGGSGGGLAGIAGSVSLNTIDMTTESYAENDELQAGSLTVNAKNTGNIMAIGGIATFGGKAGVGGGYSENMISNRTYAYLKDNTLNINNGLSLESDNDNTIKSYASTLGASGSASLAVSVANNRINNESLATMSGSGQTNFTAGNININAQERSDIEAVTGTLASTSGGASVGAAVTLNSIANTTRAYMRDIAYQQAEHDININAINRNSVTAITYSSGGTFSAAGVGAAVAVNRMNNVTESFISGSDTNLLAGDVVINADAQNAVTNRTVAITGGINAAIGGSVSTNLISNTTSSYINGGATVMADDDLAILANNDDALSVSSGSAGIGIDGAGIGFSVSINEISGDTQAYIEDSDTHVAALGKSASNNLVINNGALITPVDLENQVGLNTYNTLDLKNSKQHKQINGLAVNAGSTQHIESIATNAGAGSVAGVAGSSSVNRIAGNTRAYVSQAQINPVSMNSGAAQDQQVDILAFNHSYVNDFAGNVSGSAAAVGAGSSVTDLDRGVYAYGINTQINTLGALSVNALSTQGISSLSVGAAGGNISLVGTGVYARFTGQTKAYLDSVTVDAGRVDIMAESDEAIFLVSGGAAAAGGLAASGSFVVAENASQTQAYILGNNTRSTINTDGSVSVDAVSDTHINNYSIAGAGAGGVGIAGSVAVNLVTNHADSEIDNTDIGTDNRPVSGVNVSASNDVSITTRAGAGGAGGILGIGAGAVVNIIKSRALSHVTNGHFYTSGLMNITADSHNTIDSLSVMAGIGGSSGIGGSVAVNLIGENIDTDSSSEVDKNGQGTLTKVDEFGRQDRFTSLQGAEQDVLTTEEKIRMNSGAKGEIKAVATGQDSAHAVYQTSAMLGANVVVNAGSLNVKARDISNIKSLVGATGAGSSGIGGAVAIDNMHMNINALIDQSSQVTTQGDIQLLAVAERGNDKSIESESWAGAAGILGLGAAVTKTSVNNQVSAGLAGTVDADSGIVTVHAEDKSRISAKALGAQVGAIVAGAVISRAEKNSVISASIADSVSADGIQLVAGGSGQVYAKGQAAAGGIYTGTGVDVRASDNSVVSAVTEGDTHLNAHSGTISISATATPEVTAISEGVNVGIMANVGVSIARAQSNADVQAYLAENNQVTANNLNINAALLRDSNTRTVNAEAYGSGGALLLGINATDALASNASVVKAYAGNNTVLSIAQAADIRATLNDEQRAKASGHNGGIISLGFNEANANTDTYSSTFLGTNIQFTGGDLSLYAGGSDNNFAEAVSGSGGVVGGSSAKAKTDSNNTTLAYVSDASANRRITASQFSLTADHLSIFDSKVDSSFGSVFGGSGAYAGNTHNSRVETNIGNAVSIEAKNIDIAANNRVRKDEVAGFNIKSGSGGVIDAPAAKGETDIKLTTRVTVGDNSVLNVTGDRLNPGALSVSGLNVLLARDSAKLDSGGVLPIALAESRIINNFNDVNVQIGDAELRSVGDISVTSRNWTDIKSQVDAKTYGLASAAMGRTESRVDADTTVVIKSGAYLRSDGEMKIQAGQDKSGNKNNFDVVARTDLWNKTAIPFYSDPQADASLMQNSRIIIENGAELGSVKDMHLLAEKGNIDVEGSGLGKDAYREALEAIANAFRRLVGEDEISFDIRGGSTTVHASSSINNNGQVKTGIQNKQYLTIRKNGTVDLNDPQGQSDGVTFTITQEDLANNIDAQIARYQQLQSDFADLPDVVAAYQAEIERLNVQKSQLAGLNTNVSYINVDGVLAQSSNIEVRADNLTGTGTLQAPGDSLIQIKNHSPYFLRTDWLTIPERSGGRITFNDIQIHNNAEINARNRGGGASFSNIVTSESSAAPLIHIENTYRPGSGGNPNGIEPDIEVAGDIINLKGTIEIFNEAGSVNVGGNLVANTIDIQAGKDLVLSYVNGFRHLGGDPKSHWQSVATQSESNKVDRIVNGLRSGGSTLIAGNNIFASAKILNINGLIQSGLPDNAITLESSPQIYEDYQNSTANINTLNWAQQNYADGGAQYYRIKENSGDTIDAYYNAATDQIELQDVKVQGGYMQLFGQIISTGAGELRVLDGFGRINVQNNSSKDLVLAQLDVGTEREGQIKITDTNFSGINGQPLTTWYRRLGNQISVWDSTTVDNDGRPNHLVRMETTGQKSTVYLPKTGQYFSWLKKESKDTYKHKTEYRLTCFYITGCDEASNTSDGRVATNGPTFIRDDLVLNYQNKNDDYWYHNTHYRTDTGWYRDNSKGGGDGYAQHTEQTDFGVGTVDWYKEEWWYYEKKITDIWYHQHNVKAFHDIDINFIGYDTPQLAVASTGNILINGNISNLAGNTDLATSGSIEQLTPNASISGQNITLAAQAGIGDHSTIKTNLDTGILTATTQTGNIHLNEILGNLRYGQVQTTGNVSLTADGDLERAGDTALIKANKIDLLARYGDIGSANAPVVIDSGVNQGRGDGLTAQAARDIYLTEQSGDLLVNKVVANGGSVNITVPSGSLIDVNPNETRDTRTEAELLSLWNSMNLLGTPGVDEETRAAETIQGFENAKTSDYQRYWQYRARQVDASVYDPEFKIVATQAERSTLMQQGLSDRDIDVYDQRRTQQYHTWHSEFASLGNHYDSQYRYQATAADREALSQGSIWTENQLKFAVGGGLLKETSDTNARIEEANIAALNVNLDVADNIGSNLNDIVIDNTPQVLHLTDAQRLAMASAEAGDITISDSEIRIKQREDLNVDADDLLSATAGQSIYLASEKTFRIGYVRSSTGQQVIVKGGQSIRGAAGIESAYFEAGNLILEAARGNIDAGINLSGSVTARSGGDIDINANSPIRINTFYAKGDITIDSHVAGIIDANNDDNLNIRAHALNMHAEGAIGSQSNPLDIAIDADGELTARSELEGVTLISPDRSLVLQNVQAGNAIDIKVKQGDLIAKGDIAITGDLIDYPVSKYNARFAMQAQRDIRLEGNTRIDSTVASLFTSTLNAGQNIEIADLQAGGNLALTAGNNISSLRTDSQLMMSAENIDLTAQNGQIGQADRYLVGDAKGRVMLKAHRGIYYTELHQNLNSDWIQSDSGSIELNVAEPGYALNVSHIKVNDRLQVEADNINLPYVEHTATDKQLILNMSGHDGGTANSYHINTDSAVGTFYEKLAVKDAAIHSRTGNISLTNFTVSGLNEIILPDYKVVIYHGVPRLFPEADVQIAGGEAIDLIIQAGSKRLLTTGRVIDYKPDYIINQFSTENSVSRLGEKRSAQQTGTNVNIIGKQFFDLLLQRLDPLGGFMDSRPGSNVIFDPEQLVQTEE